MDNASAYGAEDCRYVHFIPMFVYGVLDEAFLIIGGESINNIFSVYNGMSMLASAAVANIICNLFLQLPAERCAEILGFRKPVLSNDQRNTAEYRYASFSAKVCFIHLCFWLKIADMLFSVMAIQLDLPNRKLQYVNININFPIQLSGLWLGLTLGILPLFFIDDNMDNRSMSNKEFLSGTKSEWYVMADQPDRVLNANEYCELFIGE
uniref:Uncharacterized protein n=1 Tax=Caenorhabditis japonica TaxID=281687 RepID=A0A8R1DW69_CAEJA